MKRHSSAFLICLFLLVFPLFYGNVVFAANLTVHNVDTGLSYASIQEAIDAAETFDGHTIFVEAGVYDENIVIDKSLSLIGEDKDTTIIYGGNREKDIITVKVGDTVVSGFTMKYNRYSMFHHGVNLHGASDSVVFNNSFVYNWNAITVMDSPDVRISGNNIHTPILGILVYRSPKTHVLRNNIDHAIQCGIFLSATYDNCVLGNILAEGRMGVVIFNSHDISVFGNGIIKHESYAVLLSDSSRIVMCQNNITRNVVAIDPAGRSSGNTVYHNNFIDNTYPIPPSRVSFPNAWDNGYPSGGNYWSSYNGSDIYQGPFQNVTGSDGIGDVPYVIDENSTDMYPLMEPYAYTHAIAVAYVWLGRTVVGQGVTVKMDVGISNYGRFNEIFNLTVHANTTIIDQTEVTLARMNTSTLTFTWSTTGFAKGNYTIKCTATPVPGETETADNNDTCWIIVSTVGDLTGPDGWPDGIVDMRDIGVAAQAFGTYPGHSRWNMNADITGIEYLVPDNEVDMRDIASIARHFGMTDP